ncbi:MAG: HU family DNA-binding protein [Paludibacteraceae bacterium]|nr:HU family DNA-binding protein [Paludibacteraceae bacterium]
MLTKELIPAIAEASGLTRRRTEELLSATVSTIHDCLRNGQTIQLQKLGSLELRQSKERALLHPKTGERTVSKSHTQLVFKPANSLKEELNNA